MRNRSGQVREHNRLGGNDLYDDVNDDDVADEELAGLLLLEDMSLQNVENFRNESSDLEALVGQCRIQEEGRVMARQRQFILNVLGAVTITVLVVLVLALTSRDSGVVEPHDEDGGSPSHYPVLGINVPGSSMEDDDSEDNPFFG